MKCFAQSGKCNSSSVIHLDVDVDQENVEVKEDEMSLETEISSNNLTGNHYTPLKAYHKRTKSSYNCCSVGYTPESQSFISLQVKMVILAFIR